MSARILLVDDSSFSRKVLRAMLEGAGHDVFEVDNGYTALEQYARVRPDIVMLDLVMAPISGIDVLPLFLQLDPKARIVAATSDTQTQAVAEAKKLGAIGFIAKPFEKDHVLDTVSALLQQSMVQIEEAKAQPSEPLS